MCQKNLEEYLPEQVTPDFVLYFDAFDECWRACTTDFHDKSLKNVVEKFYMCWNNLSSVTCNAFQPINGGLLYGLHRDYDNLNYNENNYDLIKNKIDVLRRSTYQALLEMVKYIMEYYPYVDLRELSEIAIKRRQHVQNYINSLDEQQ